LLTSTKSAPATVASRQAGASDDGFDLDVRIVESGPVAAVLMANTDDGCNTIKGSDC